VRFNDYRVDGFESDVGTRTTLWCASHRAPRPRHHATRWPQPSLRRSASLAASSQPEPRPPRSAQQAHLTLCFLVPHTLTLHELSTESNVPAHAGRRPIEGPTNRLPSARMLWSDVPPLPLALSFSTNPTLVPTRGVDRTRTPIQTVCPHPGQVLSHFSFERAMVVSSPSWLRAAIRRPNSDPTNPDPNSTSALALAIHSILALGLLSLSLAGIPSLTRTRQTLQPAPSGAVYMAPRSAASL